MDQPVRRLIKPTTPRTVHLLNLRGVLPSPVQAEATTESAFVQVAALCPATRYVSSQPETLELPGQNYTPDYRVETLDGRTAVWEVKLEAKVPKHRTLFNLAARHLGRAFMEEGPIRGTQLLATYLQALCDQGLLAIDDTTLAAQQFIALAEVGQANRAHMTGEFPSPAEVAQRVKSAVRLFMRGYAR